MALLKFEDFLNEAKDQSPITDKDWDRMTTLVLKGDDGAGIAATIKDKDKAIARYVAGEKLNGTTELFHKEYNWVSGFFRDFGEKALQLGATKEEIQSIFDTAVIPIKYSDKLNNLGNKELGNRFIGKVSKLILDLGYDIIFLKKNGNAITREGRDAMARNGRKWTMGYKTELIKDGKKILFAFDAITSESCDPEPTYYVVSQEGTDKMFSSLFWKGSMGISMFTSEIRDILTGKKVSNEDDY
jgi:hypothetical protein